MHGLEPCLLKNHSLQLISFCPQQVWVSEAAADGDDLEVLMHGSFSAGAAQDQLLLVHLRPSVLVSSNV